jgi:hypothetical protein
MGPAALALTATSVPGAPAATGRLSPVSVRAFGPEMAALGDEHSHWARLENPCPSTASRFAVLDFCGNIRKYLPRFVCARRLVFPAVRRQLPRQEKRERPCVRAPGWIWSDQRDEIGDKNAGGGERGVVARGTVRDWLR